MLATPHTLSLITTHRCTAACDHCCFSCSPDVQDHIPIPNLYRYIHEAAEIKTIKVIVFTGGECFLLGKELDSLMKLPTKDLRPFNAGVEHDHMSAVEIAHRPKTCNLGGETVGIDASVTAVRRDDLVLLNELLDLPIAHRHDDHLVRA